MVRYLSAVVLIGFVASVGSTNAQARQRDVSYSVSACSRYASDYAHRTRFRGEVFGGTALGSLAGFGIGSLFAASGVGAAVGAAVGIVGGRAAQQRQVEQVYYAVYYDCMARRRY